MLLLIMAEIQCTYVFSTQGILLYTYKYNIESTYRIKYI